MKDKSDKERNSLISRSLLILGGVNFGKNVLNVGGSLLNSEFRDLYSEKREISRKLSNFFISSILCVISEIFSVFHTPVYW